MNPKKRKFQPSFRNRSGDQVRSGPTTVRTDSGKSVPARAVNRAERKMPPEAFQFAKMSTDAWTEGVW